MKLIISCFFWITCSATFLTCTSAQTSEKNPSTNPEPVAQQVYEILDKESFRTKMNLEGAQLIDVRTTEETSDGMIAGAIEMDFYADDFKARVTSLDKNNPILVYCRSGGRSGNACAILTAAGFQEVYDLKGGYTAWIAK